MAWNNIVPAALLAVATDTDGEAIKPLNLTHGQAQLLKEMMQEDLIDYPEAYAESADFKALYTRVQTICDDFQNNR